MKYAENGASDYHPDPGHYQWRTRFRGAQPLRASERSTRLLYLSNGSRLLTAMQHRLPKRLEPIAAQLRSGRGRMAWLAGVAVLVATATVASIPGGGPGLPDARLPTPPAQSFLGEAAPARQATAVREPAPADSGPEQHGTLERPWQELRVRSGDTFSTLIARAGFDTADFLPAVLNHPEAKPLYQLRPGQRIRVRAQAGKQIDEVTYRIDHADTLRIVRAGTDYEVRRESRNLETRLAHVTGTIESSLFDDGQDAGLSDALILKLVEIFGWDIDFALDLRRGDRFSVVHEEKYWLGQKIADGQILAAEFVNRGRTFRAIAHRGADGVTTYFAPDGTSVRREFLRTPVEFSRISSGYTLKRFHPILKTWGAHRGVDYAAPRGTPVRATATGRVLTIGTHGGYGKRVVLKHGGAYSTLYAHLDRYAASLRAGSFVQQGQIIGYVGATGLATGPHLHYEFQVDGAHRNPLTFRFPAGAPVPAIERGEFARRSEFLTARLERISVAPTQVAQR